MKQLDDLYAELLKKYGVDIISYCSDKEAADYQKMLDEGKPLPPGITQSTQNPNVFLRMDDQSVREDANKLLLYGMYKDVKLIKSCIVFLTTLTAINVICSIILAFM